MTSTAPASIQGRPQRLHPKAIQIDATSNCQLACPLCPTADGRTKPGLGRGHLKVSDFESLLDRNPEIEHVELSNYGEMFLNPQLADILRVAHERQVTVSGGNGVNLNFARPEALEAVVKYRVRTLTCSLDGATQDTYAKYRVNGDLERVLGHIDQIREWKRRYQSAFPLLDWQFVVFGHNESELPLAKAMATERGMGFTPRLSWDDTFSSVQNADLVRLETGIGAATRDEYREKSGAGYTRSICFQLWHQPVLNWDGKVMGCCVNYWQDFGVNAFDVSLEQLSNSEPLAYARQMLRGEAEPRPGIPCTTCYHFDEIRMTNNWIRDDEATNTAGPGPLVAVIPEAEGARFAQVLITNGGTPVQETHGRLFRFGIDTAVYFQPPNPGRYSVFLKTIGARGWSESRVYQREFTGRPLCQQWHVGGPVEGVAAASGLRDQALPVWIR